MYFPEGFAQALSTGDSAMKRMRELQIPPTPTNYTVWFVYHSGAAPDLTRDLDTLVAADEAFTAERNAALFERYFGLASESQALRETGERLEAAIAKLLGYLGEAGEDASSYGEALDAMTGRLERSGDADEVREIIGAILSETRKIAEQHEQLQSNLQDSTREIEALRESIYSARQEALTDALTGIANRKAFDERIRIEMANAAAESVPLALMLLDIDHFKKFNDSFGHQFGDQVLRLVARTFTECIKGRDMAARYGGEEFAILLPQTELGHAATVAEQVRESVAVKQIVNRRNGQSLGHIMISIGIAEYRLSESGDAFIKRADQALYAAKRTGRNRVVTERDPEATAAA